MERVPGRIAPDNDPAELKPPEMPALRRSSSAKISTVGALLLLAGGSVIAAGILAAPPMPGPAEPVPMALDGIGYGATLALLFLAALPVRIRLGRPGGFLSIAAHRRIGWLALYLAALHAAGYLVLLPLTLTTLTIFGSWHMMGALLALVLLSGMVVVGLDRPRRYVHRTVASFRAWHIALSCVVMLLVTIHVTASALLLTGMWKTIIWSMGSSIAVLAVLRAARPVRKRR